MLMKNPWKTLATRPIYDNPWFRVREDRVTRPDGAEGTYSVVNFNRIAVGIVPLWEDGSVTLVGQYRYPIEEYSWEIPEGGSDLALEPIEGARRELKEETGIEAESWLELGRCHTSNSACDELAYIFLARELTRGATIAQGNEEIETRRLALKEAVEMAADGRITDAISIAALFRVERWLSQRVVGE